jgi:hypothetical protein
MVVEMIEATVHAGTMETSYLRAGRGAPVILLTRHPTAMLANDPLVQTLIASFRVIVPRIPVGAVVTRAWLQALIEGLGCTGVRVIMDAVDFDDDEIAALT